MKTVAITQRLGPLTERGELSDSLDANWSKLLRASRCLTVPMPSDAQSAVGLWHAAHCEGLIVSGGSELLASGSETLAGDETEAQLLELAVTHGAPVIGVCRGVDLLVARSGGKPQLVRQAAGVGQVSRHWCEGNAHPRWTGHACPPDWTPLSHRTEGLLDMMRYRHARWLGILWHPERTVPFAAEDIRLIEDWFHATQS